MLPVSPGPLPLSYSYSMTMKGKWMIAALGLMLCSCSSNKTLEMNDAVFTPLRYQAQAPAFDPATQYCNPILPGFRPDPSICRVGEDFYLVNSTFQYFPGLPVWHSTDLVHWESCGAVLATDEAISFTDHPMLFGLWAPQISYNPHNRKFYVVCTQVGGGIGDFFATCDDPRKGHWDGPYRLPDITGIDPSLFFDEDGRACIITATSPETAGSPVRYDGEGGILMWDFDWKNGVTTGKPRIIARGGAHPEEHPASLEGGHIYKVDGRYFLMCAEGGTEARHCEVIFQSDKLEGPYEPCAINPILTQRDLAPGRPDRVSCTGHADLVCTAEGDWYAVFLGCRPYDGEEYFNTGRETFLLPVHWRDGQPVILEAGERVPIVVKKDKGLLELADGNRIKGFDGFRPGPLWSANGLAPFALSVRGDVRDRLQFEPDGRMSLTCSGVALSDYGRPSAVFERITGTAFTASTILSFHPEGDHEAGLVCWQDDDHYMKLTRRLDSLGRPVLRLEERSSAPREKFEGFYFTRPEASVLYSTDLLLSAKEARTPLLLQVSSDEQARIQFSYAPVPEGQHPRNPRLRPVGEPLDGHHLSSRHCGGFQGAMVGVYAY